MKTESNSPPNTTPQGRLGVAAVLLASTPLANAHPGHSFVEAPPSHLLTSPDHLVTLLLLAGALWLVALFIQRRRPRRVLQFCGTAALLGAMVIWGLRP